MSLFEVKPYDREVYEKELKDFLPQKILDVHTHVYLKEFFPPKPLYKPHNTLCISILLQTAQNSRISHQSFCCALSSQY